MTHSTIDQLTDHLLGQAAETTAASVAAHLASGCRRCNRLHAMLSRVRRVGRFDASHQPPGGAVRTAKALAGADSSRRPPRLVGMRLSFDSLLSPGGAGARSLHTSSRHLVFYSQDYALDLEMDSGKAARDVVVVGQLLNRDWGPLPDVPAFLVSGDRIVSHSTTGHLGEFHVEGRRAGGMHLQLAVDDQELIDVALDQSRASDPRSTPRAGLEPPGQQEPDRGYINSAGSPPYYKGSQGSRSSSDPSRTRDPRPGGPA